MLDRIEAFRRRRPRLTDDVVTLAHGAGGKASAALVDAVFLDAFADGERPATRSAPMRPRSRLPRGDAPRVQHRLLRRAAAALPRRLDRPPRRARHRQRPRRAGRPPAVAVGGVRDRGGLPGRRAARHRRRHGRGRSRGGRARSSPATPRSSAAARPTAYITTAGVGVIPPGAALGPEHVRPGDVVLVSGTIADHGMAVMLARGDLALEADIRSDTAPVGGLVDALLDGGAERPAGCATPPAAGVGTVCNELARDTDLAVVLDETLLPVAPGGERRLRPARHRPALRRQRGQGRRRRARPTRPTPPSPPCAATRSAPARRRDRRDRRRARRHRRAAHQRSAARGSSTCSSATRCPGSAERHRGPTWRTPPARHRHGAGRRVPAVRVPARRRARARRLRPQRQRRRAHRGRGRRRPRSPSSPARSSTSRRRSPASPR